ncbi:zinc finger MYM-type protein 5-like [Rhopilema esculentum]|uniref:zinc finger MYM-type protein 5-like n=1 Tax=Rhopilema esculentum TaxID=499914 RepID=UPI0031DA80ED
MREKEAKKASRTLFEVGAYKRDKEGDSTLNKPTESSVQSTAEEEEDTDGLAASVDHDTTESSESTTDSSLNQDTVHSGSSSFDVSTLTGFPTIKELEKVVRTGHLPHPPEFPKDCDGHKFPTTVLNMKQQNWEVVRKSWLVFSPTKAALYCLPCTLLIMVQNQNWLLLMVGERTTAGKDCGKRLRISP